jgi:predicted dehydrogenase
MRIGVLGLGSAGRQHTGHLHALGHEVIWFDPRDVPGFAGATRARSLEDLLRRVEAVIVASPSSLHAEQAILALEAGRHVLVEKPLATEPEDAARVAGLAEERRLVCGVAMNLRFHPAIQALRELVREGALGAIGLATASFGYDLRRWRPQHDYRGTYSARRELGGGIVLDAIHELDYLLWLLGPVDTITAEVGQVSDLNVDVEDVALAILRFKSGALASVDLNFVEPRYRRGCTLVGSERVARWDWHESAVQVWLSDRLDRTLPAACEISATYLAEVEEFIMSIDEHRPPRTTAREGLAAVMVAAALKRAAATGSRVSLD